MCFSKYMHGKREACLIELGRTCPHAALVSPPHRSAWRSSMGRSAWVSTSSTSASSGISERASARGMSNAFGSSSLLAAERDTEHSLEHFPGISCCPQLWAWFTLRPASAWPSGQDVRGLARPSRSAQVMAEYLHDGAADVAVRPQLAPRLRPAGGTSSAHANASARHLRARWRMRPGRSCFGVAICRSAHRAPGTGSEAYLSLLQIAASSQLCGVDAE